MAKVSTYLKQRLEKVGFDETEMQAVQTVFTAIDRDVKVVEVELKTGEKQEVYLKSALVLVFKQQVKSVLIPRKPRELSEESKKKRYEVQLEKLRKKYGYYDKE